MTRSIGTPIPDCNARRSAARQRREAIAHLTAGRGEGLTTPNGEETAYGTGFPANYHKSLPHDVNGFVVDAAYRDFVRAVTAGEAGAIETLPVGSNRSNPAPGAATQLNPQRYTAVSGKPEPLGYRKFTSPLTGHVFDTQGADAGAFGISAAPGLETPELAAEMAELYSMALLRDVPFTAIEDGSGPNVNSIATSLGGMDFFQAGFTTCDPAARRRHATRGTIGGGHDLFRGSTLGSKTGPWLSQFLLAGNSNNAADIEGAQNAASPMFRGVFANVGHEDGFVFFGTQIVDQRSVVAKEGIDYLTNWPSWLDAQNGVDFNDLDIFRRRRRYLTTPRDIATYVHYDALYQAYLVACLLMLGPPGNFARDRGLPETSSRTRSAFSSFGGPHILSLVTEVATRGLKAVWRQKWMHHRRARPEVVAALLTLHENDPARITDPTLKDALTALRAAIPQNILDMIASHNSAQNAGGKIAPLPAGSLPADFPVIADSKNYLLPMAFPEGSPTHPAYGAGHATVAGACVTILKAFFEMYAADGCTPLAWPLPAFVAIQKENEGGELAPAPGNPSLTIQGELDKLAMNIANARNVAGVHFYTDYYESLRLGERVAVSVLEEQMAMYDEVVSMTFTSFDGDRIRIIGNADSSRVIVHDGSGQPVSSMAWYGRYER